MIGRGETLTTEFKESLPARDATGLLKTVAAFANGGGGTILLGVRDDGTILGVDEDQIVATLDRLTNLITNTVRPLVDFRYERVTINGRPVIELAVQSGSNTPYGVGPTDRKVAYYIRRGATTFPAAPADVREFVRSRTPRPEPHFPPLGRR
jgi:ATP-dependent DNA helicase RecG